MIPIYEPLRQRIIVNYNLDGLTKSESKDYINQSLKNAGALANFFNDASIAAAYSYSNGSIRKLNNILTKSLIIGASENKQVIDSDIILAAQNEIDFS